MRRIPDPLSITTCDLDDIHVLRLCGTVDLNAAGLLCDALADAVRQGHKGLAAEMSEVPDLTRAGALGLVVAAKLLVAARGELRIAGMTGAVRKMLR